MGSSNSSREAFRDVIDDLTVQNKTLRKKLRKYETLHCAHLQDEKLFEVKFHALPPHKKRELDDVLHAFALSVEKPPESSTLNSSRQQASSLPDPLPLPSSEKPSSSTTSNSKPVDSAYASMSTSGQTQNPYSRSNDKTTMKRPVPKAQWKQENVKSYLDDMPKGLMPKHSPVMSERSKRKLVVTRLEEIFTGKGDASNEQGQSHQQQEVSQLAAKADRNAQEAGGLRARVEGVREARISKFDADVLTEHMSDASLTSGKEVVDGEEAASRGTQASQDGTPDQRPTRPLDLDLYRAQVPADNIQYIRHLGLASPTLKTDPCTKTSDGWVYLNLLMNMAQLHTLNVTPEFVRKSVGEISTKLELSSDGRKIRWHGGTEGSKIPSDSDSSPDEEIPMTTEGRQRNNRCSFEGNSLNKSSHDINTDLTDVSQYLHAKSSANLGGSTKLRPISLEHVSNAPKVFYKPLFYHGASSEEGDGHPHDNGSLMDIADDDIGAERTFQHRDRTGATRDDRGENGPIIFYNTARFCTDLSRDSTAGVSTYIKCTRYLPEPIGSFRSKPQHPGIAMDDSRGPLTAGHIYKEHMDPDENSDDETYPLQVFEDRSLQIREHSRAAGKSMEASGLSGVQPMDHFSVEVQVQTMKLSQSSSAILPTRVTSRVQANRLFQGAPWSLPPTRVPMVKSTIVSVHTRQLPPSSLPSPSYIYLQGASSENTEPSNDDEPISESHSGKRALPSSTVDADGQSIHLLSSLSSFGGTKEESSYTSSSAVGSEDSSIDMLAHARVLDPESIAAREMEFDRNTVQQQAEIPAGSSAATAGGGSGFTSEVSTNDEASPSSAAARSSAEGKTASWRDGSDRDAADDMFASSGMEEGD